MYRHLNISGEDYELLKAHLFSGNNKEAVALALCGRNITDESEGLAVHRIICIPNEEYSVQEVNRVTWNTKYLSEVLEEVIQKGLSVVKIHCHPEGGEFFSQVDDYSDNKLFTSIYNLEEGGPHGSMIMLPDGRLFGRFFDENLKTYPINRIRVVGDRLQVWDYALKKQTDFKEFEKRNLQTFGEGTIQLLKNMKVAIIGCSGTGSPLIEQLVRLGVGKLLLFDDDVIEEKNLNRIIHATVEDARKQRSKTDVIQERITEIGLGTEVKAFPVNILNDIKYLKEIANCDFIFGCVDSVEARNVLNNIATIYIVPYIDVGVKVIADKKGGVDKISGAVHYLRPCFSLMNRKMYSTARLEAESMKRTNPEMYKERLKEGYVANVDVERPTVINLNTLTISFAINEFMARVHGYRDNDRELEIIKVELVDTIFDYQTDDAKDIYLKKYKGRGDMIPFLNMPIFSKSCNI